MQTQVVNESGAEIIYGNFTNVSGQTITTGYALSFTTLAASVDGNKAVLPATSSLFTFAGVAEQDTVDTDVGRYIGYGYAQSVWIYAIGSSVTIPLGDAMGPANAKLGVNSAGSKDVFGPVVALEAIGAALLSPGGYAQGMVRAL